jgi:hypothetical protein
MKALPGRRENGTAAEAVIFDSTISKCETNVVSPFAVVPFGLVVVIAAVFSRKL